MFPAITVWELGVAEREKPCTVNATVAVWLKLPFVPVIVKVYVPGVVLLPAFTVIVEEPEPVTETGLKLTLTPAGAPVALKLTFPLNPLSALTLTV